MAHLFVCGTLRSDATDEMGRLARTRLFAVSDFMGTASMQGVLYDLGAYPGMVPSDETDLRVLGEVRRLHDPDGTFVWLDEYEGDEYRRIERTATLAGRNDVLAWVYVLPAVPRAPVLQSGRWPA